MAIQINTNKSIRLKTAGTKQVEDIEVIVEGVGGESGVPIEVDYLEDNLLVSENENKIFKFNNALFKVVKGEQKPTDLTGYNVYIPAGWTCSYKFSDFLFMNSVFKYDNIYTNKFNPNEDWLRGYPRLYIGSKEYIYGSGILTGGVNSIILDSTSHIITPDTAFSILNIQIVPPKYCDENIYAGTYMLRSWLINNNAVFSTYKFQEIIDSKGESEKIVTENRNYYIAGYNWLDVNVPIPEGYVKPSDTLEILMNGKYNVTNYEKVNVNVIDNNIQEITTEEEMTTLLIEENVGKVYKYIGTTGTYVYGDLYEVVNE